MILVFVIALLTLCYFWLKRRYSYWERRGVPGPKPVYLFGNLLKQLTFQEHIYISYRNWHNTYTNVPYVGFYKLLKPAVMVRDPQLQREILVKAFMNFYRNDQSISAQDVLLKGDPFFTYGEEWRQSRAMTSTFFSANRIKTLFPAMWNVGNEWEQYVRSFNVNSEIDVKDICTRYTTETMLRTTFSIDGKSFEKQSEFIDFAKSVFSPNMSNAMKLTAAFIIPAVQKYVNLTIIPKTMDRRFREMVRQQIEMRDSGSVQCDDVLQFVLNSREKYQMTETRIVGICVGFFTEMCEPLSNVVATALYTLAKNPHIQDELARRIQESLEANNHEVTYDLVRKHEYLDKVATECMRIEPMFFGTQKVCTKDYTMPLLPGQTEPTIIPAGTSVVLPFANLQQDPVHFPDPDVFDPERFSQDQMAQRHKSAHLPFSEGPRMCIGMHLAFFNFKLALFQMISRFQVTLHPNNKPFRLNPLSLFLIPREPIKLIFTPRKTF